jgi:hypothetical protein
VQQLREGSIRELKINLRSKKPPSKNFKIKLKILKALSRGYKLDLRCMIIL